MKLHRGSAMTLTEPALRSKWTGRDYPLVVLEVALIGVLLRVVGFGGTLWENLVFSECIGLGICTAVHGVFRCTARGGLSLAPSGLAIQARSPCLGCS